MAGISTHGNRRPAGMPGPALFAAAVLLLAGLWPADTTAQQPAHIWMAPNGQPYPDSLQSGEKIEAFLQTAEVVSMETHDVGVTRPKAVVLEKDGVQMRAFFKDVDIEKGVWTASNGRTELDFRDSYKFECAGYILSRMLGLDSVPPVVERRIRGKNGALQIRVEFVMMERDRAKRKLTPSNAADLERWKQQLDMIWVFDNLVFNVDRNMGDILIDPAWRLWMIDFSRAFRKHARLRDPERITRVDRCFVQALRTLNEDEVRRNLSPYLTHHEIEAIFKRRQRLLALIQQRVAEKGEQAVLFEMH